MISLTAVKQCVSVLGPVWALALTACAARQPEPIPAATEPESELGTLSIALNLGDHKISSIEYTLSEAGERLRDGMFVVDGTGTFRAVLGALEPNNAYAITLSTKVPAADPDDAPLECKGQGRFAITAGSVTKLTVQLRCMAPPERESSANAPANPACPQIDNIRAIPPEADLDDEIVLRSEVSSEANEQMRFEFSWSSDIGTFTRVSSSQAFYRCSEIGIATIELRVSSHARPCPEELAMVYVTCHEPETAQPAGAFPMGMAGSPAP